MSINKAVIAVAGRGSRRAPISDVVEKCMLPILNRPVVDYVLEDCVKAGIKSVQFSVNQGSSQIQQYYSEERLPLLNPLYEGLDISFKVQTADAYGTAVPLAMASEFLKGEDQYALIMGDDFVFNSDGSSELQSMIEQLREKSFQCAMMATEVEKSRVSDYGVISLDQHSVFEKIVEKPSVEEAPSNLINISKYILNQEALQHSIALLKTKQEGEYQITDVLNQLVNDGHSILVHQVAGQYLDAGQVKNWVEANNIVLNS